MNPWGAPALLVLLLLLWLGSAKLRDPQRDRVRVLWPAAAAVFFAALCSSCGGGVLPGGAGPTPAGTSQIVVTGSSGNVSHAATAQLTVNYARSKDTNTFWRNSCLSL